MGRSEREINKIISDVLQDCREDETVYCNGNLKDKEGWDDYSKRYKRYNHFKIKSKKTDAERWKLAMESYKRYPCFSEDKGFTFEEYIIYNSSIDGEKQKIEIAADLLTNIGAIQEAVEKVELSEDEKKIVNAFYRVSGTMGNFCPVWYNPGPGRGGIGADNCWRKLDRGGINQPDKCQGLPERYIPEIEQNHLRRHMENMFMILPKNNNGKWDPKEVMQELYFQDFFDVDWKLIRDSSVNISKLDKEELIKFIKEITVLIVQRSYRICTEYKEDVFEEEDKKIIKKIIKKIGLNNSDSYIFEKGKWLAFEIENGVLKRYFQEEGVTEVIIPEGVTTIGYAAFYKNKYIQSVYIPEGVTTIETNAFKWCSNIKEIRFPNTLKELCSYCFSECRHLTKVELPESIEKIAQGAFSNCIRLKEITLPEGFKAIGSKVFENTYWEVHYPNDFIIISNLLYLYKGKDTKVVIPAEVDSIGDYAFYYSDIEQVVIPEGVIELRNGAFCGCKKLVSVKIPSTVKKIGMSAFYNCEKLEEIILPEGLEELEYNAFIKCPLKNKIEFYKYRKRCRK